MAATSSQAASSGSTATAAIGETIVGSHLLKIDGFSATKDLGVGKSIKSSTFNVGGHTWYIECYPCGADEERAGWVTLFLCLSAHNKEQVEAKCLFTFTDDVEVEDRDYYRSAYEHTYNAENSRGCGIVVIERAELESLLKDDCFQIRCDVSIVREFPAMPPPDLHRPLVDLVATRMPEDLRYILYIY
jgi:speckle-type POZ protein